MLLITIDIIRLIDYLFLPFLHNIYGNAPEKMKLFIGFVVILVATIIVFKGYKNAEKIKIVTHTLNINKSVSGL